MIHSPIHALRSTLRRLLPAAALATLLGGCAISDQLPVPTETLAISTGGFGGVYYPLGVAACRLWNGDSKLAAARCIAVTSGGSVANLERLSTRKTTLGLVQADILSASAVKDQMRVVMAGPVEAFAIVLNPASEITEFRGLKGQRIALGNPGSGPYATTQRLFGMLGWTMADVVPVAAPSTGQQSRMLCQGRLDAAIYIAASPSAFISEAVSACGGTVLGPGKAVIDRVLADSADFQRVVIAQDSYRTMRGDVETFGVRSFLVAHADEPEERIYQFTKRIVENVEVLRGQHPAFKALSAADFALGSTTVARHPGAERYLREAGLLR